MPTEPIAPCDHSAPPPNPAGSELDQGLHTNRFGISPTRTELAEGIGLKDASSVAVHLETLEREGRIQLIPKKPRSIRVLNSEDIPLLGPLTAETLIAKATNHTRHHT